MRIGVLGGGGVGSVLGKRFAQLGHEIIYGSRNPSDSKNTALLEGHPGSAKVVHVNDLPSAADVIILAVPGHTAVGAVSAISDFQNKILIDLTLNLGAGLKLQVGFNDSQGETIARTAKNARVVKAFNTIGVEVMGNTSYPNGAKPYLPVSSNDVEAKNTVIQLAASLGFDAHDFGGIENSRFTEPFGCLWIVSALGIGAAPLGRNFAFSVVNRN